MQSKILSKENLVKLTKSIETLLYSSDSQTWNRDTLKLFLFLVNTLPEKLFTVNNEVLLNILFVIDKFPA